MSSREVIERYFSFTSGGDPASIADCWAPSIVARAGGDPTDGYRRWSQAGPAADLVIQRVDEINGRERFIVDVSLANGQIIDWGQRTRRYFTLSVENGSRHIVEIATALAAP
jgi:hypothetical protein